ncbi:MAG: hypothetical protein COB67_04090 [SAR324 cluster bacterium]|uniref:Uncharacterized protein n=1 Tax=SAR324 cluster bacterium TaxID=2024889 RepID=A0A2A4T7A2_9DELT|nr:MAG: hypothetical protein COB67_04090 [SAR324 cluster bacterium]
MKQLIETLSQAQRIWFAEMLIQAILVDGKVLSPEVVFLKGIISQVDDEIERARLIQVVKEGKKVPLRHVENVPKGVLVGIFSQLIESCISDLFFAEEEKKLLFKIGMLFDFRRIYIKRWIDWGKEGVEWKQYQQNIVSCRINNREFIVPIHRMNTEQKKWYIDTMVSALMLAGLRDEKEIDLLQFILESSDSIEEKNTLKAHIFKRHRPPMKRPPKIHEEILILIFMDVVSTHIGSGKLSYQGDQQIKQLSDLSRISTIAYTQIIEWCNRVLHWKRMKAFLIANVQLNASAEDQEATQKGLLIPHPNNNSVKIRELECFICDDKTKINAFQLRHYSQVQDSNIFGITRYLKANDSFDFIDFSQIRVIICPVCYFASIDNNFFCKGEKHRMPDILCDPKFRQEWLEKANDRQELFGDKLDEIQSIQRSHSTVIAIYQHAIESMTKLRAKCLVDNLGEEEYLGKEINLRLQLVELLMQFENINQSEEELREVEKLCYKVFTTSGNDLLALKCTRVLLLSALYFDQTQDVENYYRFFENFKIDKLIFLKYDVRDYFNKLYLEIKLIYSKKEFYKKSALKGYHLDLSVKKALEEEL